MQHHIIDTLTRTLLELDNVKPPVTEFRLHPDDLAQLRVDCGVRAPRPGTACTTVFHGIRIIEDMGACRLRRVRG